MCDADCTPGREPRSVAASSALLCFFVMQILFHKSISVGQVCFREPLGSAAAGILQANDLPVTV